MNHRRPLLGTFLVAAWLAACAVPVPPSGGPPDTAPPGLVSSEPSDGAVGVRTDRVLLRFDEYIDERSIQSALSVTPAPARAPEVRYGGREVELRFREPLRDSTTYILTIDTAFRDAHGVALQAPLRIAFSTGDTIDRGRIAGRVVERDRGSPAAGIDVFAYEGSSIEPDTEPSYRTQTDREGAFAFAYLPPRRFSVLAVRDANRNRRPDPGEWLAVSPLETVLADTADTPVELPWILAPRDAAPPEIRRVDGLSDRSIAVRFSEPVMPVDVAGEGWTLTDTTGSTTLSVLRVHRPESDPRTLVLASEPLPGTILRLAAVDVAADSAGLRNLPWSGTFVASDVADTSSARLVRIDVDSLVVDGSARVDGAVRLAPWSRPALVFDRGPDPRQLEAALEVTDGAGNVLPFRLESRDGLAWQIDTSARGPWRLTRAASAAPGLGPDSSLAFVPTEASALGEISGRIDAPDSTVVVELVPEGVTREPLRTVRPDRTGTFVFRDLPGGARYRLRMFADRDGDGGWTPGDPAPWNRPEPVGWSSETHTVRARWETVIPDTLRFPRPLPADRTEPLRRDGSDSRL